MSYTPGMRLFGSPDAFAVQFEPRGPFDERWKFGHLQFWVDGHSLGDWDDSASLASAARWGRTFLAHSIERFRPDLDSWSAQDILAELYEQFLADRPADVQPAPHAKSWSRDPFLLDEVGDASIRDRARVLAVRTSTRDRIIARCLRTNQVFECLLVAGELDAILGDFCEFVEAMR